MGERNNTLCSYLDKPEIFADFINGTLLNGKSPILPTELHNPQITGSEVAEERTGKKIKSNISRDVIKKWIHENCITILAIENQDMINLIMPFRCLEYDLMEYKKQLRRLKELHTRAKDLEKGTEFLSGIKYTDKLTPIITIVFYHGTDSWDTCKELRDMLNFNHDNEILREYTANYRLNLVELNSLNETAFQTSLREVIGMMKRRGNKQEMITYCKSNAERFNNLDIDTFDTISTMINHKKLLTYKNVSNTQTGGLNMCKAIVEWEKDIYKEGLMAGEKCGEKRGRQKGQNDMSELVQKLLAQGRINDIQSAVTDMKSRKALFKEFGITV